MKIGLINPASCPESGRDLYSCPIVGPLFKMQPATRMALGLPLALPTIAAHTPDGHSIKIIDEEIEPINFDEPFDLVGLTAMTYKATRAYEISEQFRKKGVRTVMGGIHASMCPEEVLRHVDSVVIGEAEETWPRLVVDAQSGNLKRRYTAIGYPDVTASKVPRYDLVKNRNYLYTYLQTTRGCPYDCGFCTVTKHNGRKLRKKTVEQVIQELDATIRLRPTRRVPVKDRHGKRKTLVGTIAFIDDNFAIDRKHALDICRALREYQENNGYIVAWYTQVNYSVGRDPELVSAMAKANCLHVFVGFENLDPDVLRAANKKMNSPEKYEEAIRGFQSQGIRVIYSTIIGDDKCSSQSAEQLARFIDNANVFHVLLNILTPYPGTRLREEMSAQNRLLPMDAKQYNIRNLVFEHPRLRADELHSIYVSLCERIFGFDAMMKRGKKLLVRKGLSFPLWLRPILVLGFVAGSLLLVAQRRIYWRTALKTIFSAHSLVCPGTLYALELLSVSADYDDFARKEKMRLAAA